MEELVWSKMSQFLRELRCEDASRGSYSKLRNIGMQ